ncbi:hypothetical protein [Solidesulfovibrio sp.]|uniref:hypothetical protein n=1 Tax=Solidesulfovibrio sp. TaxID=2910990 RepID=UPI002635B66B|nr:hypothetical protein [Solidesulfovibrio sp.]
MPPKRAATAAVGKTLEERREAARDAALKELKALRADLAQLEAVLSGRRTKGDFSLFDVAHGAFEIFRNAAAVFEADALLASLTVELESAKALEFLEKHGATELVKPAGWHWISPRGEMHFLGKGEEAAKAAEKLATLMAGARRPRRKDKAQADQPAPPSDADAQPDQA